jgi:hypothetical protein
VEVFYKNYCQKVSKVFYENDDVSKDLGFLIYGKNLNDEKVTDYLRKKVIK